MDFQFSGSCESVIWNFVVVVANVYILSTTISPCFVISIHFIIFIVIFGWTRFSPNAVWPVSWTMNNGFSIQKLFSFFFFLLWMRVNSDIFAFQYDVGAFVLLLCVPGNWLTFLFSPTLSFRAIDRYKAALGPNNNKTENRIELGNGRFFFFVYCQCYTTLKPLLIGELKRNKKYVRWRFVKFEMRTIAHKWAKEKKWIFKRKKENQTS